MGFIHDLFWRNHDAEITELKRNLHNMTTNHQELFSKNAEQLLANERLRDALEQAQKNLSDHMLKCSEAAENTELVEASAGISEQASQLSEVAEVVEVANIEWIVAAVVITTFVLAAIFTLLCIYMGNKAEQTRNEEQNLAPETDINSSRTSSFSNLTLETQV